MSASSTASPVYLFLDDFRSPPAAAWTWTIARSAEEAREILLAGPVEAASLDHDMGECTDCASSFPPRGYALVTRTCRHRMNGLDLVRWMTETGTWPRTKPTVHSENEDGKAKMIEAIEQHWRVTHTSGEPVESRGERR
jgi:hypothetical protein